MGSLSQFEEYAGPLLRGHLSAGKGIGGIGFLKAVEDADYLLHNPILLEKRGQCYGLGVATSSRLPRPPRAARGRSRIDSWKCLKPLAGTTGLEPATSDVTGRRSNQLSYVPD